MTPYKFQLTYPWAPPVVFVLWCISFHVIWLDSPVVMEVPTVKTNRALKALCSSCKTSLPSRLSGKYAVRCVPLYCWPGFGCSGPWIPDWNEYCMQMVPHPDERNKRDQLQIEILFIIEKLVTYLKTGKADFSGVSPSSERNRQSLILRHLVQPHLGPWEKLELFSSTAGGLNAFSWRNTSSWV